MKLKVLLSSALLAASLLALAAAPASAASVGPATGVVGVPDTGSRGTCNADYQGKHYVGTVNAGATEYNANNKPTRLVCEFYFGTFSDATPGRELGTGCVDNLDAPNGDPQTLTFAYWRLVVERDGRGELICKNSPFGS